MDGLNWMTDALLQNFNKPPERTILVCTLIKWLTTYLNMNNKKHSVKISCSNVRGLKKSSKLESKMTPILKHLDTDVKVILDSYTNKFNSGKLREEYKI